MPEIELSTHPEALYAPGVEATRLTLLGVRIGDPTSRVPLDTVEDAGTLERSPDVIGEEWSDGISYLKLKDGRKVVHTFEQRLHSALNSAEGGGVSCKPGARFRTRGATVVGFFLEKALLIPYQALRFEEIKLRFGKEDRVDEDWAMGDLMGSHHVYTQRQLIIYWHADEQKITEIGLGQFIIDLHDSFRAYNRA